MVEKSRELMTLYDETKHSDAEYYREENEEFDRKLNHILENYCR